MLGIWCGVIALIFIELMKVCHRLFERLPWPSAAKAFLGGGLLVLIGKGISTRYLGLGLDSIAAGLGGTILPAGATLMKAIATAITLGCGGSGGVVTPIFFIGTAAGNLFASLFHEPSDRNLFRHRHGGAFGRRGKYTDCGIRHGHGAVRRRYRPTRCRCLHGQLPDRRLPQYLSEPVAGYAEKHFIERGTGKPLADFRHATVHHRTTSLMGVIEKGIRWVGRGSKRGKKDGQK